MIHTVRTMLLLLVSTFLLLNCTKQSDVKNTITPSQFAYMSLDGLWQCTPETALKLRHRTLDHVIRIYGQTQHHLSIQGCFMEDDDFRTYWWVYGIEYDDSTRQVSFQDEDNMIYIGTVNPHMTAIRGVIYNVENDELVPDDSLNFVRAPGLDEQRLFYPRPTGPDGSVRYAYHTPDQLDDDIETTSIYHTVPDTNAVYKLMQKLITQEYGRLESLLILKNKKLVLEEYFYQFDRSQLHYINSCTKSIVSLLTGIAFEQYGITDFNAPIFEVFPQLDSLRTETNQSLTLQHVLTMNTGFEGSDAYLSASPGDVVKIILGLPQEYPPGEHFQYGAESSYLMGGLVHLLSGMDVEAYAIQNLFGPLGITNYTWDKINGNPACDRGLELLPRDMAKIGLLVINNGVWNGQQIVPASWIKASTSLQVVESEFQDYGYQWWHRSDGKTPWWDKPADAKPEHDMAIALGYGGQYIFVIKDLDLIITMTSSDNNQSNGMAFKKYALVIEEIVPMFE